MYRKSFFCLKSTWTHRLQPARPTSLRAWYFIAITIGLPRSSLHRDCSSFPLERHTSSGRPWARLHCSSTGPQCSFRHNRPSASPPATFFGLRHLRNCSCLVCLLPAPQNTVGGHRRWGIWSGGSRIWSPTGLRSGAKVLHYLRQRPSKGGGALWHQHQAVLGRYYHLSYFSLHYVCFL